MTKEELAALINGREYRDEVTPEIIQNAKENNLVIVFGASDDLMELRGAIDDEIGCYDGGFIKVHKQGILSNFDRLLENEAEESDFEEYFKYRDSAKEIEAVWGTNEASELEYSWVYRTEIPHACFDIVEGNEKYCKGIVFSLNDLASAPIPEPEE